MRASTRRPRRLPRHMQSEDQPAARARRRRRPQAERIDGLGAAAENGPIIEQDADGRYREMTDEEIKSHDQAQATTTQPTPAGETITGLVQWFEDSPPLVKAAVGIGAFWLGRKFILSIFGDD